MPARQMERLITLLKPGGRLYLTVPNSASWVARLSGEKWNMLLLEHLWYFDPATLTRFLGRCGFAIDTIKAIGYPVDLATVLPAGPPDLRCLGAAGSHDSWRTSTSNCRSA